MADIEEAEGHHGAVREWLSRAARAPRDKAWVADGMTSDRWAPVSPRGTLDAFVWRTPDERLAALSEPESIEPESAAPPARAAGPAARRGRKRVGRRRKPAWGRSAAGRNRPGVAAGPLPAGKPARPEPAHASSSPAPSVGVIIDPASMAPDDPGPGSRGVRGAAPPHVLDLRKRLSKAAFSAGERHVPFVGRHRRRRARGRAGRGEPARRRL